MTKNIVYTPGEPGGIGADIIIQLAQREVLHDLVCLADRSLLEQRARQLGLPLKICSESEAPSQLGQLRVKHWANNKPALLGKPSIENVETTLAVLDVAIDGCLSGEFSAMVTGPLHKGIINDAGVAFTGHTEYLADRTKAAMPVMLLASKKLRVALMTTHLPLKDVSEAITQDLVTQVCRIIDVDLRTKYGIAKPRQLVCGLNPHAGEGGHLGMEEIETIIPALNKLRQEGLDLLGPLPADTLFTPKQLANADVVVAMFHDQGLPVLKAQSFGEAANITLGLPIIRTSVDHGTAFDLAGTGRADIGSLRTAVSFARDMRDQSV